MRKLVIALSVMALPLAACGTEEPAPPEADPMQQVIEEPAMPPEDGVIEDSAADEGAVAEEGATEADKSSEGQTTAE
ncbi:hypothetical protein [Parasphingorhabdus halotolerans]|uniref:Uncharacterized protein n=1 Tax=Parasphingorhabdus halotolerans TaxID=2725558 RepID=A0A6H2DL24_9SPHN|nr:hypothetical protein [Parasphingorhabdus halotolerans]QJB69372.1 hypothetical protein HF685_08840 [Parasphingorhabdus halotolerans]